MSFLSPDFLYLVTNNEQNVHDAVMLSIFLQCFDTVGWVTGRTSGLSEVGLGNPHTCMWGTGVIGLGDPPPNVTSSR